MEEHGKPINHAVSSWATEAEMNSLISRLEGLMRTNPIVIPEDEHIRRSNEVDIHLATMATWREEMEASPPTIFPDLSWSPEDVYTSLPPPTPVERLLVLPDGAYSGLGYTSHDTPYMGFAAPRLATIDLPELPAETVEASEMFLEEPDDNAPQLLDSFFPAEHDDLPTLGMRGLQVGW